MRLFSAYLNYSTPSLSVYRNDWFSVRQVQTDLMLFVIPEHLSFPSLSLSFFLSLSQPPTDILSQALKKQQQAEQEKLDVQRKELAATPSNILFTTKDVEQSYPIANRNFDGRAVDPSEYAVCSCWRSWH